MRPNRSALSCLPKEVLRGGADAEGDDGRDRVRCDKAGPAFGRMVVQVITEADDRASRFSGSETRAGLAGLGSSSATLK